MKSPTVQTLHLIVAMMFAALLSPLSASAVGPSISASVYDGRPATITIENHQNNSTIYSSPILLEGAVVNVSQIMVYIDNVYSMTYALDEGATRYSFSTSIGAGQHVIKLIAVNPFDSTTTETSITVTYEPGGRPPLPTEAVNNVSQGAQATKEYFDDQVSQASVTEPAKVISDAAYSFMRAIDLVSDNPTESIPRTLGRFAAVIGGLSMLLFTNPIITLYYFVRYTMLKWNIHALPRLVHSHARLVLRSIGVLCLVVVSFMA